MNKTRHVRGRACLHWLTTSSRVGIWVCAFSRLLTCGKYGGRQRINLLNAYDAVDALK